jgi:hypothetical protein
MYIYLEHLIYDPALFHIIYTNSHREPDGRAVFVEVKAYNINMVNHVCMYIISILDKIVDMNIYSFKKPEND